MNGCFSRKNLQTTPQSSVGCFHLKKPYKHGQIVSERFQCQTKICSAGVIIPVFKCQKRWSPWKKCSKSCGAGKTSRRQICNFNPVINMDLQQLVKMVNETCSNQIQVTACFERLCQESCKVTQWSDWSPCNNKTCKTEYQSRLRQQINVNKNEPKCTKGLMESRRCLKTECPCEENAVVSSCANIICPTSCDHMNQRVRCVKPKQELCVQACVCKSGYLYQNGKCIPKSNCLCFKPEFNSLILNKVYTELHSHKSTKVSFGKQKTVKSQLKESISKATSKYNAPGTTKISISPFKVLLKKDLEILKKNADKQTLPWAPGITNAPLYQATPQWLPGTTPGGPTMKPLKKLTIHRTRRPPPTGHKAIGKGGWKRVTPKIHFYVTKRYVPISKPKVKSPTGLPSKRTYSHGGKVSFKPQLSNLFTKIPLKRSSQKILTGKPDTNITKYGDKKPPGFITATKPLTSNMSSNELKARVPANSTLKVDCQSCVCLNGELTCSGPHCSVGKNKWSDWTSWSPCTAVCGIGFRRRFRQCQGIDCKDTSPQVPGLKRIAITKRIQAEDKSCLVTECSCIYSKEIIGIHMGKEKIRKYKMDLGTVWVEKDNIKGLSNSKELVSSGDVIKSRQTIFTKCAQCICQKGQFVCNAKCG